MVENQIKSEFDLLVAVVKMLKKENIIPNITGNALTCLMEEYTEIQKAYELCNRTRNITGGAYRMKNLMKAYT